MLSRAVFPVLLALSLPVSALDRDGNQQSDLWELVYAAPGLPAAEDADRDGFTNAMEAAAGTDPLAAWSFPVLESSLEGAALRFSWELPAGKTGQLIHSPELSVPWQPLGDALRSTGERETVQYLAAAPRGFFRLRIGDTDTDGDGLTDYEEGLIGFDPARENSQRSSQTDAVRAAAGLDGNNVITVGVYDESTSERWPDPALLVLRRGGTGLQPLEVPVTWGGTALQGVDYTAGSGTGSVVRFEAGRREAFVEITPVPDSVPGEGVETVILTVSPGAGYTLGPVISGTVLVEDGDAASPPSAKEAARFLIQAAWGPDQDSAADPDQIPENVEEVMALGFEGWIDEQFSKPQGRHQPLTEWFGQHGQDMQIYGDYKQFAWWSRVLDYPKLSPEDAADTPSDPLRQRIAYCLSQILVVSDRTEDLANERPGMANYYDLLLRESFGNYRDLLMGVALHPCMGMYLSHLGNKKPDPSRRIYPDENFAREVMQLFTIGLWELNPDGTRKLDAQGQPVPSYDNNTITELARVFTGLSFGQPGNNNFSLWPRDYTWPMKGWDAEHDLAPKTLLRGLVTPARAASPGNTGTATMADVSAAVDNLFQHPNCGPFVCHKLIQRLVTSNPAPEYVGRVAAVFADNGSGVRGDLKAVVKAILLDEEARSFDRLRDPAFGKLREPLMKVVNFARAFNASSLAGWYQLDAFALDHLQEPQRSPSVFNFYLPTYSPPGELAAAGLAAPEFQLVNASSAHLSANYYYNAVFGGLHRWGVADPSRQVRLNLDQEMAMNIPAGAIGQDNPAVAPLDPDPLIRRLDLALTGGTLSPETLQLVRENMHRTVSGWQWPKERLRTAIYLIMNSADFAVQR